MAENSRLTPKEFWLGAAQWGSYMRESDPGKCMYGFDEHGRVQSEAHRKECIAWLDGPCREADKLNTEPEDRESPSIDDLIAYLRTAPKERKRK